MSTLILDLRGKKSPRFTFGLIHDPSQSKMEVLTFTYFLDYVSPSEVIKLCLLSREMKAFYPGYLQYRAKKDLEIPDLIIDSNPIEWFMTERTDDFVVRRSEDYVGVDEALFRAVMRGRKSLIILESPLMPSVTGLNQDLLG